MPWRRSAAFAVATSPTSSRVCTCARCRSLLVIVIVAHNCGDSQSSLGEALDRHQRGEPLALEVVRRAGQQLGSALGGLVDALHVRRFVLAGAMAAFGEAWMEAVASAASDAALSALAADTTFELGGVEDVVVLGASALLMTRELGLILHPHGLPEREGVGER